MVPVPSAKGRYHTPPRPTPRPEPGEDLIAWHHVSVQDQDQDVIAWHQVGVQVQGKIS